MKCHCNQHICNNHTEEPFIQMCRPKLKINESQTHTTAIGEGLKHSCRQSTIQEGNQPKWQQKKYIFIGIFLNNNFLQNKIVALHILEFFLFNIRVQYTSIQSKADTILFNRKLIKIIYPFICDEIKIFT